MIHSDLRFEGFDARSWTHLLSLFLPGVVQRTEVEAPASDDPGLDEKPPALPGGTLLVVVDEDDHAVMALHTRQGRISHLGTVVEPRTLCATYAANRCVILREGALDELAERVALRIDRDDDYLEQALAVLRTAREMQEGGLIRIWPRRFAHVPIPTAATVERGLDLVLPSDRVAVLALWRSEHLWTAVALRRRQGRIDWVVGPDFIGHWCGGAPAGDLRRSSADVLAAIAEHMGPVHLGVFAEAHTLRRLLRQNEGGAWAAATAGQEILIQPMPPYVAMALGADVLRAVARSSTRLFGDRFDVGAALTPLADAMRERLGRARSLTQTLGFDPLELLARYLQDRGDE
ncbi:MAG: hypothetical protein ACOCXM_11185 [Myxococcota bacterium]